MRTRRAPPPASPLITGKTPHHINVLTDVLQGSCAEESCVEITLLALRGFSL
jgi:hypothetical protein